MNKKDKQTLDEIAEKLRPGFEVKELEFITGTFLKNISPKLSGSKLKKFFQELERHCPIICMNGTSGKSKKSKTGVGLTDGTTLEKMKKELKAIKKIYENLENGIFPKEIPGVIIGTYRLAFSLGINFVSKAIENYEANR